MATGPTATRRLLRIPLVGLLGALLLVANNGLLTLPFLAAQRGHAATEEEPPPGDADDTSEEFTTARGRPGAARRTSHRALPAPTNPASSGRPAGSTPSRGTLGLSPPPRERDRLNGIGTALRC